MGALRVVTDTRILPDCWPICDGGGGTFSVPTIIAEECQDVDSNCEEEQAMSEGNVRAFFELGALPDGAAPMPLPAALDGDDADAYRLCADECHPTPLASGLIPGSRCTHQAPRISGSGSKQRSIEIAGARESGSPGLRARGMHGPA